MFVDLALDAVHFSGKIASAELEELYELHILLQALLHPLNLHLEAGDLLFEDAPGRISRREPGAVLLLHVDQQLLVGDEEALALQVVPSVVDDDVIMTLRLLQFM